MPLGRVKEGGIDNTVGHGLDTDVRGRVDSDDPDITASMAPGNFRRPDSHAVVMGINEVDVAVDFKERIDGCLSVLLVPV